MPFDYPYQQRQVTPTTPTPRTSNGVFWLLVVLTLNVAFDSWKDYFIHDVIRTEICRIEKKLELSQQAVHCPVTTPEKETQ